MRSLHNMRQTIPCSNRKGHRAYQSYVCAGKKFVALMEVSKSIPVCPPNLTHKERNHTNENTFLFQTSRRSNNFEKYLPFQKR